jgi:hypothetical protein
MKKLVAISILLILMSTVAFAQFKVGFTADITPDLIYATVDTEDPAGPKGSFNILGSSVWDTSELRLNFKYTGENYEASLDIKGDGLLTRGTGVNADPPESFFDLFGLPFGDFYVKGTAGIFSGYWGNTANRGKMNDFRFANFNDYLKNDINKYGYIDAEFANQDVDNLSNGSPYVSVGLNLAPITVELASDLGTVEFNNPNISADKIGAVLRVSGDKIADLISFDVIYKIKGEDRNNQARGTGGAWDNKFGLYAGLGLGDIGLGFGF